MINKIAVLLTVAIVLILGSANPSNAQQVPDWIKNNAGWWAKGQIDDNSFIQGIQFLIKENVIQIPSTTQSSSMDDKIPEWMKSNAGWWAEGQIDDDTFVKGIQYLISVGAISIPSESSNKKLHISGSSSEDPELSALESELEKCKDISQAYKRLDCEKKVKSQITLYTYKKDAQLFEVGPINFYWKGLGSEGNAFEISPSGQAILSLRFLAENARGQDNASMMCTGPSICNYDVWNGDKAFKYSGNDFTNGNIVLKPKESREFNMVFGPNIGYGGTTFEYFAGKDYVFRIQEPWGSASIQLPLKNP